MEEIRTEQNNIFYPINHCIVANDGLLEPIGVNVGWSGWMGCNIPLGLLEHLRFQTVDD